MAKTAGYVINSALSEITVSADEAPLEPSEIIKGIEYLNDLMAELLSEGINLGYTEVSSPSDILSVSAGAIKPIIKNLAIDLSPTFGGPDGVTNQLLFRQAQNGMKTLRNIGITIKPSFFGDNVPRGSGSEDIDGLSNDAFFHYPDDSILTEGREFIQIESGTNAND